MADPRTIVEGSLKYRDGRKWKSRWCVVSKLSPVADCLHLQLYRDSKDRCKNGSTKASLSLEGFLAMETGFTLDKESNTMALICNDVIVVLAFDSRELLIQWQVKIRTNLVEDQQYLVQIAHIPPKSKLTSGPARLHLQDYKFCLTAGVPPRLLGIWPIKELRRYGVVDGKYCFEGGSRCGRGEGLHVMLTNQAEDLAQAMDLASKGKLQGRRKHSSRKHPDPSSRMSFQPKCHHRRESEKCSAESSRPLLSSGSDGSTCDVCSDSFRADGTVEDSYSAKQACRIHYRWPSCASSRWASTPATELPEMPTISDFQDQQQLNSLSNGIRNSCPCENHTWSFSHCSKCGGRYCTKDGTGRQTPDVRQPIDNGFTPQWTMDLTVVSPCSEVGVHNRKGLCRTSVKSPPDRNSLCSQSSQSSGTSSGSGSEYSVPRSCLDTLYDRPRSIHHVNGHGLSRSPPRIMRGGPLDDGDHRKLSNAVTPKTPIQDNFQMCTCRLSNSADIPKVHGVSYPCTCWTRTMPNPQKETSSGSGSSTGSPSSSPKKVANPSRTCGTLPGRSDVHKVLPPCTCRRNSNSYGNYSVPRSALANTCVKERPPTANGDVADRKITGISTTPREEYDIPKRFQEQCTPVLDHQDIDAYRAVLCTCGRGSSRFDGFQLNPPSNQDHLQVCNCQRVIWWAGNLVPCWRKDNGDETVSLVDHSFVRSESDVSVCKMTPTVCKEPPRLEFMNGNDAGKQCIVHNTNSEGSQANSHPNYVNLDYSTQNEKANYANLRFIETLPYYENASSVLAKLTDDSVQSELVKNQRTCKSVRDSPSEVRKGKFGPCEVIGSAYELMTFPVVEEDEKSQKEDNYMVMQPAYSAMSLSGVDDSDVSEDDKKANEVERTENRDLPLRPFMPYLLPCQTRVGENVDHESEEKRRENELRSTRSNSLSELKKKMLMRKRSNSADTRSEAVTNDGSETDECPGSPSSCPRYSTRKTSLFSKFTLRSKEKSFSTNEITPPSSVPSTPNNDSLENLHRAIYHRSADCLKLEENIFSDDELSRDYEDGHYKADSDFSCLGSSIKRSSSVPCKPSAEGSSSPSPSDSGFSTSLPRSSGVSISPINNSHIVSIHNSLPRKYTMGKPEITLSPRRRNKADCDIKDRKCRGKGKESNQYNRDGECRRIVHPTPSTEGNLLESKITATVSSSSSDMSDYIETLSLCSRSSTSSGSSSDYVRAEDICTATHKSTNVLKPRSGKEYDSAERLGLGSENKEHTPTENREEALNYLEMNVTSTKGVVNSSVTTSVQYAVIDAVATAAARKVSTFRTEDCEREDLARENNI